MEDVIGIPTEEQALASVGGGDKEIPDAEKERIAQQIISAARANASWRAGLPFDQQMALANVPTVSAPPVEDNPVPVAEEPVTSEVVPPPPGEPAQPATGV